MPNWCANSLVATGGGAAEYALELLSMFTVGEEVSRVPFFHRFVPEPDGVAEQGDGWEYGESGKDERAVEANLLLVHAELRGTDPLLVQAARETVNAYEPVGWYAWRLFHWGCKWDANDFCLVRGEDKLALMFDTPWRPPIPFVAALSRRWPEASFRLSWCESGMEFAGSVEIRGGRAVEEHHFAGPWWLPGAEGRDFSKEVANFVWDHLLPGPGG